MFHISDFPAVQSSRKKQIPFLPARQKNISLKKDGRTRILAAVEKCLK